MCNRNRCSCQWSLLQTFCNRVFDTQILAVPLDPPFRDSRTARLEAAVRGGEAHRSHAPPEAAPSCLSKPNPAPGNLAVPTQRRATCCRPTQPSTEQPELRSASRDEKLLHRLRERLSERLPERSLGAFPEVLLDSLTRRSGLEVMETPCDRE